MSNFQKILDSFSLKDTLNQKIWENPEDPKKSKMVPKVRKALMKIANEFIDYLGDDAFVEDIVLTGSLANFNWSEFSDFDLHIIVDVDKFGKQKDTYKELFNLKKQVFNDKHDIKIFGYDVELYAQDQTESHKSSGVYSLMENKWIHQPKKDKVEIDKDVIESKVKNWHEKIDNAIEELNGESLESGKKKIESLKDKLKEYRKSGLEDKGELAYENLVFKFLRRDGTIEKLFNAANKFTDQELSIEQQLTESIKKYLSEAPKSGTLFGGSTVKIPRDGAHAGQSGWPSGNAWDIKAPVGSPVFAIGPGVVEKYADYGTSVIKKGGKKLYGQGLLVKSEGGLPGVYYAHLQNATKRKGDKIECGELLGYVMDFPGSSYDHVHIGLEWGHNIREFLNDDGTLKCAKGIKLDRYGKSLGDQESNPVFQRLGKSEFLQKIYDIAKSGKSFEYFPGKIKHDSDVEVIQTALQFLGFSLPKWGVDGKFGPETSQAVKSFQDKYDLTNDGKLENNDLRYLVAALMIGNFKDEDLSNIQKEKEINLQGLTDKNFYETLLRQLGAPISDENLKFLYAWRQAEGKGGKNNPFNTTWKLPGSTNMNKVGVKHYLTKEDGMLATLKTLRNGRYSCIVNGLKNDIGAAQIAKCPSLETWGTGDLVAKVVKSYESGASPKIKDLS
jgi:peptidoglycan hydrolase-like protein with peptidoglycan-binding domain/murein DD-endopeptidase MepM/ murein hydrolase activator NlpD